MNKNELWKNAIGIAPMTAPIGKVFHMRKADVETAALIEGLKNENRILRRFLQIAMDIHDDEKGQMSEDHWSSHAKKLLEGEGI